MMMTHKLFLSFLSFAIIQAVFCFECRIKQSPNCDCIEDATTGEKFELSCRRKGTTLETVLTITYIPPSHLLIDCNRNEDGYWDVENYEYLSELQFSERIEYLRFRFCPPPNSSFIDVTNTMGIRSFSSFAYQSWLDMEGNFTSDLLKGLRFVNKLEMDNNNFTVLSDDFLQDMSNLTSIDLMRNRLSLSPRFFSYTPNLKFIELGGNDIVELPQEIFYGLKNLKQLNLQNNNIESITNEFEGLAKLRVLEISFNRLANIDKDVFLHTPELQNVSLAGNSLSYLPPTTFSNTRNLTWLTLSGNKNITSLPENLLQDLTSLIKLELDLCSIEDLKPDSFRNLRSLVLLDLDRNKLSNLSGNIFKDLVNLEVLDLSANHLTQLPVGVFKHNKNLLFLDLSRNKISSLKDGVFNGLVRLKNLNLANNQLHNIDPDVFSQTRLLEELDISKNNLTFSSPGDSIFFDYGIGTQLFEPLTRSLKVLNVSHNAIEEIPFGWQNFLVLQKLDLSNNQLRSVEFTELLFQTDSNIHLEIDLTRNLIETLNFQSAPHASTSRRKKIRVQVGENPFMCDCAMFDVIRYIKKEMRNVTHAIDLKTDGAYCFRPEGTAGFPITEVDRYLLVCRVPFCIDHCTCFVRPADRSLIINCENANLTRLPDELPKVSGFVKTELNLGNNLVQDAQQLSDPLFENLSAVNLSNNALDFFEVQRLPSGLGKLQIDNNNIETLEPQTLSVLLNAMNSSDLNVSLAGNPWKCRCENIHLLDLLPNFHSILDLGDVRCINLNRSLIKVTADEFCPTIPIPLVVGVSVSAVIFVTIISFLLIFYYKNQRVVKAWLYSKGWFLSWVSEEEVDKDKKYDAFVSFANEDEEFVIRELVPKLENSEPKFKLCLHTRDWPAGEFITDNIFESVGNSRRTIVLLTNNYLKSSWCLSEFQTAYQHAVEENTRRLILIVVGNLPPLIDLPKELRAYISTNTYLRSDDQWFWNKLLYAMPHGKKEKSDKSKSPNSGDRIDPVILESCERAHSNGNEKF
ncbi:protein toll-like isoform X2 [Artemia franciscana]|uniref:protein toll-like isoform X2 n=1 Tax=Artemia franciscana TaxID=6661 RepID=UPI0032D9F688